MNLVRAYKRLPDAARIPDELYALDDCLQQIEAVKNRLDLLMKERDRLNEALLVRLSRNWSPAEIAAAGF